MKRACEEGVEVPSEVEVEGPQKKVKPSEEREETQQNGKQSILKSEQLHPVTINGNSKNNKCNGVGDQGVTGIDAEFEALVSNNSVLSEFAHPTLPESATEAARRNFVERLAVAGCITEQMLLKLLAELREEAPQWGTTSQLRSIALLLVYVARSSRTCRASFVANGLPLLGELMQDSVAGLEGKNAASRQEAGMRVHACLTCLAALSLGRATMWEHRLTVGKGFDQLHRWCGHTKTALAADLRAPTLALCRRWRKQPRPAFQDASPEQKKVRVKVIEIIRQGLLGISGASPVSPAVACSSVCLPPATVAAEIEAALLGCHNGNTPEYRQHARMLKTNLALSGNSALRERILSGDITAETLVSMDSRSLAPETLQVQRRSLEQEYLKLSVIKVDSQMLRGYSEKGDRFEPETFVLPPPEDSTTMAAPSALAVGASPLLPMEPPPTPFQGGNPPPFRSVEDVAIPTPAIPETPGVEEEREHETELIRWFTKPM